jgi:hypothetical protein
VVVSFIGGGNVCRDKFCIRKKKRRNINLVKNYNIDDSSRCGVKKSVILFDI